MIEKNENTILDIDNESLYVLEGFLYNYLCTNEDIDNNKFYHLRVVYEAIAKELERLGYETMRTTIDTIDSVLDNALRSK